MRSSSIHPICVIILHGIRAMTKYGNQIHGLTSSSSTEISSSSQPPSSAQTPFSSSIPDPFSAQITNHKLNGQNFLENKPFYPNSSIQGENLLSESQNQYLCEGENNSVTYFPTNIQPDHLSDHLSPVQSNPTDSSQTQPQDCQSSASTPLLNENHEQGMSDPNSSQNCDHIPVDEMPIALRRSERTHIPYR
ncbi:hypothetical protein Sjap_018572 [Stephania japonica]|uniref:Uncharacterized protein n=1 Tax=Stephania japonica TaxID=461633 RepID=A0AAP0NJI6_9MAGN